MSRVLITVEGGVATVVTEDENMQVLIVDYDVDGCFGTVKNPNGEECEVGRAYDFDPPTVNQYFNHFQE